MVGRPIGGVNVFGGGLALYVDGQKVGGLGVSGDTSCTDHFVAWRTRNGLHRNALNPVKGVADNDHPDNVVYDIANGVSAGGFGHPKCSVSLTPDPTSLPAVH